MIQKSSFGQYSLEIEITGLNSSNGVIMLQLFDQDQKVIGQDKGIIKEKKCLITFSDLKPGKYACRYFHDENLSGKMETNKLGIPKEGYGFSNDASGLFGPKPFNEWLFEITSNKRIMIRTKY